MIEERRRHPRSKEKWQITIETPETTMSGETENISCGGVFINCLQPLPPNEIFEMMINIPERGTALKCKAKVVWSTRHGMGVQWHSG
jgi:hypothetical protein